MSFEQLARHSRFRRPGALLAAALLGLGTGVLDAATIHVTSTGDAHQDGATTLREAVVQSAAGDTIVFDVAAVDLTAGEIQISHDLTIDGAPGFVVVERDWRNTHVPHFRIFNVVAGHITLANMRIDSTPFNAPSGDEPTQGGAIFNNATLVLEHCEIVGRTFGGNDTAPANTGTAGNAQGGGLYNKGAAKVTGCTISGNAAGGDATVVPGASGGTAKGGAIYNDGTISIDKCLVEGGAKGGTGAQQVVAGTPAGDGGLAVGGGLYNNGSAVVTNTTFYQCGASGGYGGDPAIGGTGGNGGDARGGGIANGGDLHLVNVTAVQNSVSSFVSLGFGTILATYGKGGHVDGGGLYQGVTGVTRMINTVVARNSFNYAAGGSQTNRDVSGAVSSEGHNAVGIVDESSGWGPADQLGTEGNPIDPHYAYDLADVGGPTRVLLLQFGSSLIDAGDDAVALPPIDLTTDQRLLPRKIASHVDIGATEFDPPQVGDLLVNTGVDHSDGTCGVVDCTLRDAINTVNADPTRDNFNIRFAANVTGTVALTQFWLGISHPVTISGPGPANLQIVPQHNFPVFRIYQNATREGETIAIRGLRLSGADVDGANGSGAIENTGNLVLTDCVIADNKSQRGGGGITNVSSYTSAHLIMSRCTLNGNSSAGSGGAILNYPYGKTATLEMTDCTIANNSAGAYAGAIYNGGGGGEADAVLTNCTIADNVATGQVSGIYDSTGDSSGAGTARLQLANCLLSAPAAATALLFDHQNGITSLGSNLSSDAAGGDSGTGPGGFLNGPGDQRNTDPRLDVQGLRDNGGLTPTIALQPSSPAINNGNDSYAPPTDQRGLPRVGSSDIGAYELQTTPDPTVAPSSSPTITPGSTPVSTPASAAQSQNISTRVNVLTGDRVMIGGFIVTGSSRKTVIIRAIGPSSGVSGALGDPTLELHSPDGGVVANDNWKIDDATGESQEAQIRATGVAPLDDRESAIVQTLSPGSYTAVVRGKGGTTGVALVEVYDLQTAGSALANISTRGFVDSGDNVMIGGFIIGPSDSLPSRIALRAIGPSIGVAEALADPVLELHNGNGLQIAINDNWQDDASAADISRYQLAPADPRESAMIRSLTPGNYTAVVRGVNNTTGVGLVEVYNLR